MLTVSEGGPLGDGQQVCAFANGSIGIADTAIRAGDTEIAVTGGMESMSQAPHLLPGARFGYRMGNVEAVDSMVHDGLTNPFTEKQMINEASEVSNELEITRVDMDRFAERSHRLAAEATDAGRLADEITGVTVKSRKGENTIEADEAIRPETTIETLAGLRAIGGEDATHTAGNAPGVNDGAAAVIVASTEWAEREGKTPLATVLAYGTVADDYAYLANAGQAASSRSRRPALARRRRPLGDQRSLRLGRAQLDPDARHRRGQGQRQRRRDRPRPPDRRLRRPHRPQPRPRARPPRRRPRRAPRSAPAAARATRS